MQAIAALIAGIRGAENGSVQLLQRGTSTRATWYSSFEGDDADSSGADIALDANGGAVVFVNGLVTVRVLDSDGVAVRSFTDGATANNVEYQGQSFTGVNYDDATTGTGNGYPTTIQAILDLVYTSFGTTDFNALLNGSSVTIQAALGHLTGLIFNVKDPTYGAVGDGVANDGAAIDAALAAATSAGGIVYFPPGTYLRTTALSLPAKVSLLGAGPNASTISINHASNGLIQTVGGSTYRFQHIAGLRLTAAQANSSSVISISDASRLIIDNCHIGGGNCDATLIGVTDDTVTEYKFHECTFEIGALNAGAVSHAGAIVRGSFRGCRFIVPGGNYAPADTAVVYANSVHFDSCIFDGTAATAGTFSYFRASSTTVDASLRGCSFKSTGGGAATAITLGTYLAASVFHESGSNFGASDVTAYSYTVSSPAAAAVQLMTRETRVYEVTSEDAALILPTDQYGYIRIRRATNADQQFSGLLAPVGATQSVVVWNNSGNTISNQEPVSNFVGTSLAAATVTNGSKVMWKGQWVVTSAASTTCVLYAGPEVF